MSFQDYARSLTRNRNRRAAGLIVVEHVESTLLLCRQISEEYIREGTVPPDSDVVAWHQRSGRGRRGRRWSSPAGLGVYATLIRRAVADGGELAILPLRVAVALCETLTDLLDGRCQLKWPNDLRVGEKKLGGILIETLTLTNAAGSSGDRVALIAFGVNHAAEVGVLGESQATSLRRETSASVSLAELTAKLLAAVDAELMAAAPDVLERYRRYSMHRRGDLIAHRGGADDEAVEGRFLGFDDRGFLRLDVEGEERTFSAGEIAVGGRGD